MITIRWFLAEINTNSISCQKQKVEEYIKKEFNIEVYQKEVERFNNRFTCCDSESLPEIQNNQIVVLGDVDIHNQEMLKEKYEISKALCTEDLLIHLYRNLGIDFLNELVGEFSFILYDSDKNLTYAVRDHVGIKTLYWIKKDNKYIFANDIFILQDYFNIKDLEMEYFKEFLDCNGIVDSELTPYKEVKRVSSGYYLELNDKLDYQIHNYWDLCNINGNIKFLNEKEYEEKFKEIFFESVKSRLKKNDETSIMLSGGLDSTSIYAASKILSKEDKEKKQQISSISAVFNELKESDEQIYINELLDKYKDKGNYKEFDNELMYENFPENIPFSYEPHVSGLTFEFTNRLVKGAAENGINRMLTGFAGDQLLTGSLDVTNDFIKRRKLGKALSYVTKYSIATNSSAFKNFFKYTLSSNILDEEVKNKESSYYTKMKKKMKKIRYSHQKQLYYQISNAKAHLYMDRTIGAIHKVDIKHPLLDRRLIEFVYTLPGELRFSDYHSKLILRNSLGDILTERIKNRINKTTHLAYTYKSIRTNWEKIYSTLSQPQLIIKLGFISLEEWNKELMKWRNGIAVSDSFWLMLAIELWISKYNTKVNN